MDAKLMELKQVSWEKERERLQNAKVLETLKIVEQFKCERDELKKRNETLTTTIKGIDTSDSDSVTQGFQAQVAENQTQQVRINELLERVQAEETRYEEQRVKVIGLNDRIRELETKLKQQMRGSRRQLQAG